MQRVVMDSQDMIEKFKENSLKHVYGEVICAADCLSVIKQAGLYEQIVVCFVILYIGSEK
ncbi:hypothetical protein FRX31_013704 [Thalictrum thalictroides]|uniref:Uncharacterized protein n=1 Tax=Thalictrum thalictroides TaxID=46969 RepID=A0A7J6WIF4_THATH|nr:hypothetical protein FRX31_013704 [Thalictrum thalictroides]